MTRVEGYKAACRIIAMALDDRIAMKVDAEDCREGTAVDGHRGKVNGRPCRDCERIEDGLVKLRTMLERKGWRVPRQVV